ncbi:MAG: hypothetical protein U9Q74_13950 [Gemmatimonadota bacterium]|nr:hypothetical protein [Gemmatimonadota bacterium]
MTARAVTARAATARAATARAGFAAPLAVLVLLAVALLGALGVDAVIGESRAARAGYLEARAAALAESALAEALAIQLDSVAGVAPPGTRLFSLASDVAGQARATAVVLQHGLVMVTARAEANAGGVRAIAGRRWLARIVGSGDGTGEARLAAVSPNGWLAVP